MRKNDEHILVSSAYEKVIERGTTIHGRQTMKLKRTGYTAPLVAIVKGN